LAEADPADDALPRALSALAEAMGWDFAALWLREGDELRCEATWRSAHAPVAAFDQATRETRLARGEGLPSRVLAEGGPEWSLDFAADARNPRAGAAREAGLHGAVAFPMRTGGRVVGVLELLGRDARAPDEPLVRALETIGGQMGLFRARAGLAAGGGLGPRHGRPHRAPRHAGAPPPRRRALPRGRRAARPGAAP